MNSSWRRPVWLVAIVPAVSSLLFLAGCSNNNPAPPGDAAATEPATTVAADEDEIVHLSQEKAGVPSPGQTMFTSAEQAAGVFKDSVLAKDRRTLAALFGDEGKALVFSGDKVQENNDLQACGQRLTAYLHVDHPTETTAILRIGSENWPFPIPVVKGADGWFFDTVAGRDELLNRRIGEDELNAIAVCRAYVLAQNEYAKKDRMGGGVVQFAQHMMSRAGTRDGLYWEVAEGEEMSPMGPLVAEARMEGYPATQPASGQPHKPHPYKGYLFHILKAQGDAAPGGAMSYLVDGKMTQGFALVASPSKYDASGIMTFIVARDGKVYQKDLGPKTRETVKAMTEYNPDKTWTEVKD